MSGYENDAVIQPIREFRDAVRSAFAFLEELGFSMTTVEQSGPEVCAEFRNATTFVSVAVEIGGRPWVTVGRLTRGETGEHYDLAFLLEERSPGVGEWSKSGAKSEDLRAILEHQAKALAAHGTDILNGDFTVFDRLRLRAEENLRRRERELYGDT